MKKIIIVLCFFMLIGCHRQKKEYQSVIDVNGGQGVFASGQLMYINGSAQISCYKNSKLIKQNKDVFKGYLGKVNHMGALSGDQHYLYVGVEYFDGRHSKNLQVGLYDVQTLRLKRFFAINPESGQKECSAVAYDDYDHTLWLCEWGNETSSEYFYHYRLNGQYLGKVRMKNPARWIQGIAFYKHTLYIASDDGDANKDEPDHIYRTAIKSSVCTLEKERTLNDVIDQGEIEGLSATDTHLYVLYNRGAKVVNGKVIGLEQGYKKQLHEIYVYKSHAA